MYYVKVDSAGNPIDGLIIRPNLEQAIGEITDEKLALHGFSRVINVEMPVAAKHQYVTEGGIFKNANGQFEKTWTITDYTQTELVSLWIRPMRDRLLFLSDWTQMPDAPLLAAKKTEWANYRQQLRDMTSNPGTLTTFEAIVWPTQPLK